LDNTLAAYWSFNGSPDDVITPAITPNIFIATLTEDRFGAPGSAYFFDGSNDYISYPDSPAFDSAGSELSISCWVQPNYLESNDPPGVISKGNDWALYLSGHNFGYQVGGNYRNGTVTWVDGQWYHLVLTFKDGNKTLYVDGIQDGLSSQDDPTLVPTSTMPLLMGQWVIFPR